jgi:hypothetical protein
MRAIETMLSAFDRDSSILHIALEIALVLRRNAAKYESDPLLELDKYGNHARIVKHEAVSSILKHTWQVPDEETLAIEETTENCQQMILKTRVSKAL